MYAVLSLATQQHIQDAALDDCDLCAVLALDYAYSSMDGGHSSLRRFEATRFQARSLQLSVMFHLLPIGVKWVSSSVTFIRLLPIGVKRALTYAMPLTPVKRQ